MRGVNGEAYQFSFFAVTNPQILRTIGQRIREARLKNNLTQECLAELVGVHWKTIGHIERGSYPIALTTFARVSQFLETSPNRLLDGLRLPDPERAARIKKALARKRAPRKTT
jgi:DNA-binding XRE family transcriptional regulator